MTDPDLDRFIAALRDDLPSPQDDARMRQRLRAGGLAVPAAGATGGLASTGSLLQLQALSRPVKVALFAALAGGTPAAVMLTTHRLGAPGRPAIEAESTSRMSDTRSRRPSISNLPATNSPLPPLSNPTEDVSRPIGDGDPRPVEAAARPSASRRPRSNGSGTTPARFQPSDEPLTSTLAAETELIERALAAIEAHDHAAARQALQDHARRFPDGWLTRERHRALQRLSP